MPTPSDTSRFPEDILLKVLRAYYEEGKDYEEIAQSDDFPIKLTSSQVGSMVRGGWRDGYVHVAVMPTSTAHNERLDRMAERLRAKYNLMDCVVVHGRKEFFYKNSFQSSGSGKFTGRNVKEMVQESIVDDIAKQVSILFDKWLRNKFPKNPDPEKSAIIGIHYGSFNRKVESYLRPSSEYLRDLSMKDAYFVAAQGARWGASDRYDASTLARDFARAYGCRHSAVPVPAFIGDKTIKETLSQIPLINEALDYMKKINMAVSSIGGMHWKESSVQDAMYKSPQGDEFKKLVMINAIGNIGEAWFDSNGKQLECSEDMIFGMTIKKMQDIVGMGNPVIVGVGADVSRIPALYVSLKSRIVNILVTDEATAGVLLGELKMPERPWAPDISTTWTDTEKQVISEIDKIY
jgi:DNA-binding transcriptional regulator LsrR (DeoR family)